jgi:hypothetical protein
MPSRVVRKVSLAEEIAALQARFTKIESITHTSITRIVGGSIAGGSFGPAASWASLMDAPSDIAFQCDRPIPILVLASTGTFYGVVSTGPAIMRVALVPTFASVTPLNDVNGNPLISGFASENSADPNGIASGSFVITATIPARNGANYYHLQAQYLYGGVGAVFFLGGAWASQQNFEATVFQLSG